MSRRWNPTKAAQDEATLFNRANKVGTPVVAYPGPLDGRAVGTLTRTEAFVLGGHTAAIFVEGISGCLALTHVRVVAK